MIAPNQILAPDAISTFPTTNDPGAMNTSLAIFGVTAPKL
jgi:hypothetical protein